ncbi:MAG: hypothetical protein QW035_00935 [Candidatus Anstonellales archaeon]
MAHKNRDALSYNPPSYYKDWGYYERLYREVGYESKVLAALEELKKEGFCSTKKGKLIVSLAESNPSSYKNLEKEEIVKALNLLNKQSNLATISFFSKELPELLSKGLPFHRAEELLSTMDNVFSNNKFSSSSALCSLVCEVLIKDPFCPIWDWLKSTSSLDDNAMEKVLLEKESIRDSFIKSKEKRAVKIDEISDRLQRVARVVLRGLYDPTIRPLKKDETPCAYPPYVCLPEVLDRFPDRLSNIAAFRILALHESMHISADGSFILDKSKVDSELLHLMVFIKKRIDEEVKKLKNEMDKGREVETEKEVSYKENSTKNLLGLLKVGSDKKFDTYNDLLHKMPDPELFKLILNIVEDVRIDCLGLTRFPGFEHDYVMYVEKVINERPPIKPEDNLTNFLEALIQLSFSPRAKGTIHPDTAKNLTEVLRLLEDVKEPAADLSVSINTSMKIMKIIAEKYHKNLIERRLNMKIKEKLPPQIKKPPSKDDQRKGDFPVPPKREKEPSVEKPPVIDIPPPPQLGKQSPEGEGPRVCVGRYKGEPPYDGQPSKSSEEEEKDEAKEHEPESSGEKKKEEEGGYDLPKPSSQRSLDELNPQVVEGEKEKQEIIDRIRKASKEEDDRKKKGLDLLTPKEEKHLKELEIEVESALDTSFKKKGALYVYKTHKFTHIVKEMPYPQTKKFSSTELDSLVNPIKKAFEEAVEENIDYSLSSRGKRLDINAYLKWKVEKEKGEIEEPEIWMTRKEERQSANVIVLFDLSGSTRGGTIKREGKALYVLSKALNGLPLIDSEISAFVSIEGKNLTYYFPIKSFSETIERVPILQVPDELGLMNGIANRDGAAIRHALKKLEEKEGKKLLIIVSDGSPCHDDTDYMNKPALEDVKEAVEEARAKDIEVISVVVSCSSIGVFKEMYNNNLIVNENLNTLVYDIAKLIEKWARGVV